MCKKLERVLPLQRRFNVLRLFLPLAFVATGAAWALASPENNLAEVATASTSYVSGDEHLSAVNNGYTPTSSGDRSHGAYGNWPATGSEWVQYEWTKPVSTAKIAVYWFDDHRGVRLPTACRLQYWTGTGFAEVAGAKGLGLLPNRFNVTTFEAVKTTKLRLEFDSDGDFSTGILQWRVLDTGDSPNFPPVVSADRDRYVVLPADTLLEAQAKDDGKPRGRMDYRWEKTAGPGKVRFSDANSLSCTAKFSEPGVYTLRFTADDGELKSSAGLTVHVVSAPAHSLEPIVPARYQVSGPFWRARLKSVIVDWIPYCANKIENPNLREGGLQNFVAAAAKMAGQKGARQIGAPFANAWVYNILESMCRAQMVDPGDDSEIAAAQRLMRDKIAHWIPTILAAQEPDGYLHTQHTITGEPRWSDQGDHEGYSAGYFLEAAIAHYRWTSGKDLRLYNAAKRLADCWYANIGPAPKKAWFDGHEELEQALMSFARLVDEREGKGAGSKYRQLAKFLLDSRKGGDEYDQSHEPLTRQYDAVGHAVRALYAYCGVEDVATDLGDPAYASAALSLWDSIVNRKYYVTGGVGSGETSEGFGPDYSLPNYSYCESCADCAELFFQHEMQLAYGEARFADLYEDTLYNAVLGSLDLAGDHYTYTNSLDSAEPRYKWHVCPCCVGNIPRTLLRLPEWTYSKSADSLYVNLYFAGTVSVGRIAGTTVDVSQDTDYPWSGRVKLSVKPAMPARFAVRLRVPDRNDSGLYSCVPRTTGTVAIRVNGHPIPLRMDKGYAVVDRRWKSGDAVEIDFPMGVQRIGADPRIKADVGRVALRYGPLIYNFESVDQDLRSLLPTSAALRAVWRSDLLGGVIALEGSFADGSAMLAIPNYARLNRGGRSVVWIKAAP
jgi:hypothetical protein